MSWELEEGERELVLALSARERYVYFIQLAVDTEEVWGLRNPDGWVLAVDALPEGERDAFPIWPHSDFAAACAVADWEGAQPAPIGLAEMLEDLLPILEEDGLALAVFPAMDGDSAIVEPEHLRRDLAAEVELGQPDGPEAEGGDGHEHEEEPES
jgi:Protein of unknown function (DUF2750)